MLQCTSGDISTILKPCLACAYARRPSPVHLGSSSAAPLLYILPCLATAWTTLAAMAPQPGVYYGPDEDETTKDLERYFIAGDFITGTGFGESQPFAP